MYKYHTPAEYHAMIVETEAQIEEKYQLDQLQRWAADPRNAQQLHHIKSELDRVAPQRQPAQRPAAQPAQAGKLPAVINGSARFHPSHLKLKPATSQVESIRDPLVMTPGATIRQR
jgi:hypothetical protein